MPPLLHTIFGGWWASRAFSVTRLGNPHGNLESQPLDKQALCDTRLHTNIHTCIRLKYADNILTQRYITVRYTYVYVYTVTVEWAIFS